MDRHIVPGIEAKHAAEAHLEDLKIQDEFRCRCMTYWVDENHDSAFCLIDAPNIDAVKKMHDKAHGLVPHEIIQVNSNVVEAFLGRVGDPNGYFEAERPELKIFNDPAFRIILVSHILNPVLLQHQLGKIKTEQLRALYHDIVRQQIAKNEGREVEAEGEGFIISFVSVTQAVNCAMTIQKNLHVAGELLQLRLGINAGMPVDKNETLFGATVKMANYLCTIGNDSQISITSIIRELYKDDGNNTIYTHFKWIDPIDENFLQLLFDTLSAHFHDPTFNVKMFCKIMSLSKSKLYRKCMDIAKKSPNTLIRDYRLLKSLEAMKMGKNISQTTYDVGFNSPSYFTKCFYKQFGINPSAVVSL
jgi:AraC-like DNA-binding protein